MHPNNIINEEEEEGNIVRYRRREERVNLGGKGTVMVGSNNMMTVAALVLVWFWFDSMYISMTVVVWFVLLFC